MNLAQFPGDIIIDPGAERNTLACIIKSNEAWMRLPHGFGSEEFAIPINKALWIVVDNLHGKGASIDPIVIQESLSREYQKELDDLGGWSYISTLQDLPIDPRNIEHESKKLLELSTRRRIAQAGDKIYKAAASVEPINKIREGIEAAIGEIDKGSDETVTNIAVNGYEFIEKKMASPKEIPGLSSGMEELDRVTQGFQPGRLYVVGARKKIGKSVTLLNWAKHISVDNKVPVLWISTEHTIDDEYSRLLSLTSNVFETVINNGTFSQVDAYVTRVADANEKITNSPFYFVSMPFFSLDKIRRLTRKMVRVYGVKILFFDYIKTPEGDNHLTEWQQLGVFTFGLKALANQENIPVVTAVQMNRKGQQSFNETGDMDSDDFAGSDRIAQALSVAFILRKPSQSEALDTEQFRILRCTDNRHGPANIKLLLDFNGDVLRMTQNRRL